MKLVAIIVLLLGGVVLYAHESYTELCNAYKVPENVRETVHLFLTNVTSEERELLLLVNKDTGVTIAYVAPDLIAIPADIPQMSQGMKLRALLLPELREMLMEAKKDGVTLRVLSAYRSFERQKAIYERMITQYGKEYAMRVSAPPGHSQHQLGVAIDFNSLEQEFGASKEGKWLADHAYRFGFSISYPQGEESFTGYMYEPWHYRYVGKKAAAIIYLIFSNNQERFLRFCREFFSLSESAQRTGD